MLYSKQKVFCNCCGKQLFIELPKMIGRTYKVCSIECAKEMEYREAKSIMGK